MKIYLFVLPFCFFISSCDIFSTRSPEKPDTPRSAFQPATTPQLLIQNLKNAFKDKVSENYIYCFVDSSYTTKQFSFSPTAEASLKYNYFNNWDVQSERQYFINLMNTANNNATIVLNLYNEEQNFHGDSTSYSAQYQITVPAEDEQKQFYQGNLRFTLFRDTRQQWVILYWQDIKDKDFPSWSELKGSYY